jgi:hypothetical protein
MWTEVPWWLAQQERGDVEAVRDSEWVVLEVMGYWTWRDDWKGPIYAIAASVRKGNTAREENARRGNTETILVPLGQSSDASPHCNPQQEFLQLHIYMLLVYTTAAKGRRHEHEQGHERRWEGDT